MVGYCLKGIYTNTGAVMTLNTHVYMHFNNLVIVNLCITADHKLDLSGPDKLKKLGSQN